jgi:NAD(P)-dependent dehydrogenase (short-subunit alcohol dehydrogenase family)
VGHGDQREVARQTFDRRLRAGRDAATAFERHATERVARIPAPDAPAASTFGTLEVTQAVLPQVRERRAGVVINVTSSVTYKPLPLVDLYRASKAAVKAFTESLAGEMEGFGACAHRVAWIIRRNAFP